MEDGAKKDVRCTFDDLYPATPYKTIVRTCGTAWQLLEMLAVVDRQEGAYGLFCDALLGCLVRLEGIVTAYAMSYEPTAYQVPPEDLLYVRELLNALAHNQQQLSLAPETDSLLQALLARIMQQMTLVHGH